MYICLNLDFYLIISADYKRWNRPEIKTVIAQIGSSHAGNLYVISCARFIPSAPTQTENGAR